MDDLDGHIFSRINKVDELRIKRRELKIFVTPKVFVNLVVENDSEDFINLNQGNEYKSLTQKLLINGINQMPK